MIRFFSFDNCGLMLIKPKIQFLIQLEYNISSIKFRVFLKRNVKSFIFKVQRC